MLLASATPIPAAARVLAAVSGGPDSTALLLWLREAGVEVAAAHYDHALRPGSERDGERVADLCRRLGVELVLERRSRPLPRGSVQAGARVLRYDFLDRALRDTGRDLVCLGHTADDVVEGAVLHLLRGSGLAGLRGMPGRRGPYLRPLLAVWRAEIERYLAARAADPLRDPSNADSDRYARARVRHLLLPRLEADRPGLTRRLHAAATTAARLQERLEAEAGALVARGAADRGALRAVSPAVRLEAYRQLYGRLPGLSRAHLEALDRLALSGRTGAGVDLPGGLRFRVEAERVTIGVSPAPPPVLPALAVRPCRGCGDSHAVHLRQGAALTVGYRRPGLRLRPLGSPGTRKLQDVLTDAKVPRHLRDRLPLVFADGRLAWVPGIAVDVEAAVPPGVPSLHVNLEGAPETLVVLSPSAHPRSPLP
jgi:tRNA(Ile)-lysidine synthase